MRQGAGATKDCEANDCAGAGTDERGQRRKPSFASGIDIAARKDCRRGKMEHRRLGNGCSAGRKRGEFIGCGGSRQGYTSTRSVAAHHFRHVFAQESCGEVIAELEKIPLHEGVDGVGGVPADGGAVHAAEDGVEGGAELDEFGHAGEVAVVSM